MKRLDGRGRFQCCFQLWELVPFRMVEAPACSWFDS